MADRLVGRGPDLVRAPARSSSSGRRRAPCAGRRTCTASRSARRSPRRQRRSARAGRSGRRRPRRARPPRARARRPGGRPARCRPSSRPPGTRRPVLGERLAARSSRSSERSSCTSTKRTTMPMSSASASHGATFPSWSRRVTSTSSPASSSRASARVSRKLSAVMLCPNATSPGSQPRNDGGALVRGVDQLVRAAATSRTAPRRSRCPRAGSGRSRRSPRRGTASRPARRRRRAGGRERRVAGAHRPDVQERRAHATLHV